jgi:hypothetical protein
MFRLAGARQVVYTNGNDTEGTHDKEGERVGAGDVAWMQMPVRPRMVGAGEGRETKGVPKMQIAALGPTEAIREMNERPGYGDTSVISLRGDVVGRE